MYAFTRLVQYYRMHIQTIQYDKETRRRRWEWMTDIYCLTKCKNALRKLFASDFLFQTERKNHAHHIYKCHRHCSGNAIQANLNHINNFIYNINVNDFYNLFHDKNLSLFSFSFVLFVVTGFFFLQSVSFSHTHTLRTKIYYLFSN